MAKLDDLIDELRNDGREEDAEELEKLSGSSLRKKAAEYEKAIKRAEEAEAQVEKLEAAPKVRKAFEDAGVDMTSLSKLERKALEGYDGELDEEAIASFVEENELPLAEGSEGQSEEEAPPAAKKVAEAARRSGEGRGNKAPQITPDDASAWTADKAMGFAKEHPEEWEALKRNETVVGVTG